jgi:hypothetical protein
MVEMLKHEVTNTSAWKGDELKSDSSWIRILTEDEINEIEITLDSIKQTGLPFSKITSEMFKLPLLGKVLIDVQNSIDNNRGLFLLKGFPAEKYDVNDLEKLIFGISTHIGNMIVEDTEGTLIDHVTDRGASYDNISVRGYTTNAELTPHCDSGDVLGLMCIRPAKEGGLNTITSSMSIYNEVLKNHPEYLEPLYRGFHFNIRGNGPPGKWVDATKHRVPIYSFYKGNLSCRYNQKAILTAEELDVVPKLTKLEIDAINYVAEVAMMPELRFDVMLEPGDILLLNNHTVFHTRSSFTDFDEVEKRRLLLRLWINLHNVRELEPKFAEHYNTGPKQGPHVHVSPHGDRNQ